MSELLFLEYPIKNCIWFNLFLFYTLIKGGVKIYTYTNGFVHSKVFLSDDEIATVGTINLDYRSLYLHFECGIYMKDTNVIKDIKKDFEDSFKESHKVDEKKQKWFI